MYGKIDVEYQPYKSNFKARFLDNNKITERLVGLGSTRAKAIDALLRQVIVNIGNEASIAPELKVE
jgi:hypothetical protein